MSAQSLSGMTGFIPEYNTILHIHKFNKFNFNKFNFLVNINRD